MMGGPYKERTIPEAAKARPPANDQFARELFALPAGWVAMKWERKGGEFGPGPERTELTGAVCPPFERGRRKGQPAWRNRDRATEMTITLLESQYRAWLRKWETETGLCSNCQGSGRSWASSSAVEGSTFRPCVMCGETGCAQQEAA